MNGWLDALVAQEATVRLTAFASLLILLLAGEYLVRGHATNWRRQSVNLLLVIGGSLVLRVLFPVLAVGLAIDLQSRGIGLFNIVGLPQWLEIVLAVLIFDAAIYWQHRLTHRIPLLWRLHRVHHSDIEIDVTTALRFHPLEIAASMLIKLALVVVLGPHPAAMVLFELLLSAGALLTHTAQTLPEDLDRRLRLMLVTPAMHRIHHSVRAIETDSNFGFHLSVWDRLFGSYRAQPIDAPARMQIGLAEFRRPQDQGLLPLLLQPLRTVPRSTATKNSTEQSPHA